MTDIIINHLKTKNLHKILDKPTYSNYPTDGTTGGVSDGTIVGVSDGVTVGTSAVTAGVIIGEGTGGGLLVMEHHFFYSPRLPLLLPSDMPLVK